MIFYKLNHSASKHNTGYINIYSMDWTTSILSQSKRQMWFEYLSLKSISASAIRVQLQSIELTSEHNTAATISIVYSFFWHISGFRYMTVLIRCTWQTRMVTKYTASWKWAIDGVVHKVNIREEQWLWGSFVYQTRFTAPIFWSISMPCSSLWQFVHYDKRCTVHCTSMPGFLLDWSISPEWCQQYLQDMA